MANYKIDYTGAEINTGIRKSIDRKYCSQAVDGDVPVTLTFATGEVGINKVVPGSITIVGQNGFESITNGVKYVGPSSLKFMFNGTATLGVTTANTIIHFKLCINDVVVNYSQSSVKLASSTDLSTINASCMITLSTNDTIKIYAEVDKECTISVYHPQLTFLEI